MDFIRKHQLKTKSLLLCHLVGVDRVSFYRRLCIIRKQSSILWGKKCWLRYQHLAGSSAWRDKRGEEHKLAGFTFWHSDSSAMLKVLFCPTLCRCVSRALFVSTDRLFAFLFAGASSLSLLYLNGWVFFVCVFNLFWIIAPHPSNFGTQVSCITH